MSNTTAITGWTSLPSGVQIFSRSAGPPEGKVVLLLHGYPSSSHQFRKLIPVLATEGFRVLAPDLPGFGFTKAPIDFTYSFETLASTVLEYLDAVKVKAFIVYIFDYGAPTGLRIALQRPSAVKAIISQNGNAYEEGLLPFWDPIKQLWAAKDGSEQDIRLRRDLSAAFFTLEATRDQYVTGEPNPEAIDPASWTLDSALFNRGGNKKIQIDLLKNYRTNVALYPAFQKYFRDSQVPLLAIWGKNDPIFGHPELFKRDLPNAQVHTWDGGHFLLESHTQALSEQIIKFAKGIGY